MLTMYISCGGGILELRYVAGVLLFLGLGPVRGAELPTVGMYCISRDVDCLCPAECGAVIYGDLGGFGEVDDKDMADPAGGVKMLQCNAWRIGALCCRGKALPATNPVES